MCDMTPMNPYIAELRAMRARVEESLAWLDTLSPATATVPPCGAADHPLDRAVAGDPSSPEGALA
jgi:hypothetical protein